MMTKSRRLLAVVVLPALLALAACDSPNVEAKYPEKGKHDSQPTYRAWGEEDEDRIFGPGGFSLFGNNEQGQQGGGAGIGVNAFLWRASLDTFSFMPLTSADAFGGVIITDWYAPPSAANERFKANIYILGRALRADGVRVSVFRQVRDGQGGWVDAPIDDDVATDLENKILTRARELRRASA